MVRTGKPRLEKIDELARGCVARIREVLAVRIENRKEMPAEEGGQIGRVVARAEADAEATSLAPGLLAPSNLLYALKVCVSEHG